MAQESRKHEKDETGCQPPEGPVLCANSCGFFGSKATMNMCSKCYRDLVVRRASSTDGMSSEGTSKVELKSSHPVNVVTQGQEIATGSTSSEPADVGKAASGVSEEAKASRPPTRCFSCNKRVGLTGFSCRCGNMFCSLHRYSDKHQCSVDYKAIGRDAIAKANPIVKAEKFDKM
ncbi:hypothetical protein O6H91_22G047500 [Diphasiastrum complanatum]|nr:hypothetical protein O6H91_22G047500 [Diphasiastrum complanatum]